MTGGPWEDLTPIQWEAVKATAEAHLRDPVELAYELRPLVYIDPLEPVTPADSGEPETVNIELTTFGRTDTQIITVPDPEKEPRS